MFHKADGKSAPYILIHAVQLQWLAKWAATIPPFTFWMEACGSAHQWGRRLAAYARTMRLLAAEFVEPSRRNFSPTRRMLACAAVRERR
jgi:hypothetical protein